MRKLFQVHDFQKGPYLNVWEEKNADGKASGKYKWTSLMWDDKKKLLRDFPRHENTVDIFIDINS